METSAAINGVGAFVTGIVLVVVAVTKAHEGAWIILLLIPVHVIFFRATRKHYDEVQAQLSLAGWTPRDRRRNVVLAPISGIHRAVVEALDYAKTLSSDVRAVYVGLDPQETERLKAQWPTWGQGVELVVLDSPYRSLMEPLLEYIETLVEAEPPAYVTVALPEFVPARWWHHLFHNQSALRIKGALLFKPNTVVTSVPFHLTADGQYAPTAQDLIYILLNDQPSLDFGKRFDDAQEPPHSAAGMDVVRDQPAVGRVARRRLTTRYEGPDLDHPFASKRRIAVAPGPARRHLDSNESGELAAAGSVGD